MASDDEWDTGAEQVELQQDKFNKFDPAKVIVDTEPDKEVVRAAEKPVVKPVTLEPREVPVREGPKSPVSQVVSEPPKPRAAPPLPTRSVPAPEPVKSPVNKKPDDSLLAPRTFATRVETQSKGTAFTEKLDPEALQYFTDLCQKPFSDQAVAFLNAYWQEVGSQADFIFSCAWEKMKYADMHFKGVQYIHLYDEGNDLDFNIGLYFYEILCKEVLDSPAGAKWRDDEKYAPSMPTMMTALVRKQELREKVDVNFDGRISFLEYLLYQYREYANPADFVQRSMATGTEHPEITAARRALEEVNKAIRAFETEKQRLEKESKEPGVKGLSAKAKLAILNASPLAETLNVSLITAEAAVRRAVRQFGGGSIAGGFVSPTVGTSNGALWWMQRDLSEKKRRYGRG